jgi:outer membrane protein assembly factor BamB
MQRYFHFLHLPKDLIFCAFALFATQACQQVRSPNAFNLYGGASRSGNYEDGGSFANTTIINDFPKKNDSLALKAAKNQVGANMPPVPISFITSYLTLLDGNAARYAGGRIEWKAPFDAVEGGKRAIAAVPAARDKDDNLYVFASDGALYAIGSDGKRRWKQALFPPNNTSLFSDILVQTDGVVAGFSADGTRGTLIKCAFDGTIAWRQEFTLAPTRAFAADEAGNIVLALTANTPGATDSLLSLAPNGARRWAKGIANTRLLRMPIVGAGQIFMTGIRDIGGKRDDVLFALDASGNERFAKVLSFTPQGIAIGTKDNAPLLVAAGYRTGMGEALSLVVGMDANGKELWKLSYDLAVMGAPMISQQNIVFIGTKGEAIGAYFMSKDGVFQYVVSMSDAPPLCLIPSADSENNILFAATDDLGIIKIGKLPVQRLLPY